ncbi:MAG: phosphoribosylglycinamide formyltransferase [Caulobacteraceae bacterium]
MTGKVRVGVLISGRGSNMSALVAAAKAEDYPARDRPGDRQCAGRRRAGRPQRAEGVEAIAIESKPFGKDRQAHEQADGRGPARSGGAGGVPGGLAGFMRLLTPWFVDAWSGRLLNIHPSLLPDFKGLHTHARAIAAGKEEAGCSVHVVTAELDDGPILGQARVPVLAGDTEDTLAARVLKEEHRLYPQCLAQFCLELG